MNRILHHAVKMLNGRIASRWLILLIDIFIVWVSLLLAYIIRFNFEFTDLEWAEIMPHSALVVLVCTSFFLLFRSYASIVRHTSLKDAIKVFQAVTAAVIFLVIVSNLGTLSLSAQTFRMPLSIILIFYLNTLFALIFVRILIKLAYHNAHHHSKSEFTNVLIFGAGELGMVTKNTLLTKGTNRYRIIGFVDENPGKIGKTIEGVDVYKPSDITIEFINRKKIDELVFSIQNINPEKKRQIMDELIKLNITIKTIPPVENWINGELKVKQIEKLRIEDLLQRDPIKLNNPKVKKQIREKVVLVTGGAGSIGSEIVRQLTSYNATKILIVDNAETPMFELKHELVGKKDIEEDLFAFILADVTDKKNLQNIFSQYRPAIIYHAAAYKHVPLMEDYPSEALRVNVFGTKNVADLAVKFRAERFVMVSTDKAVRPTNVMGASKRFAEMYCQFLGNNSKISTKFITTRFGNVLGSNGSVVKIFRKQIEKGGPVTVTHPEITRYFMTIPEACQLVLEASIMGSGSDIFVFDMGEPVKIMDLAFKMIKLAGREPEKDIKIICTGLRPGEKLFEELLSKSEDTLETYHPKIMIAKVDNSLNGNISSIFTELRQALSQGDPFQMVNILKRSIPEYISNNSQFQKLDKIRQTAS